MIIYILFILFLTLLNFFQKNISDIESNADIKRINNRRVALSGFIFLVLLFGLRHPSMGNVLRYLSNNGYLGSFDIINSYSWTEVLELRHYLNYEAGYIILNKIIGSINNNQQFFLMSVALISLYPVYRFVKTRSASPYMSYIIFLGLPVFLMYFSGLRQVISIGICLYALDHLEKKEPIRFLLVVFLASFFHYSAWVFVLAYPLYYIKIGIKARWISVGVLWGVFVLRSVLFPLISVYLKQDATVRETGAFTLFFVFSLIYVFCFVCIDYKNVSDERINGYLNLFYGACVVQSFAGLHNLAMRVGFFYMIELIVLLPDILDHILNNDNKTVFSFLISSSFALYGLYSLSTSTWAMAVPYYFFWQSIIY